MYYFIKFENIFEDASRLGFVDLEILSDVRYSLFFFLNLHRWNLIFNQSNSHFELDAVRSVCTYL